MSTLPDGPYSYYTYAKLPPIIVEVFHGGVMEVGEEGCRPLSGYRGRFVRLVEANADAIADLILENSLAADALADAAQEPVADSIDNKASIE